MPYTTFHRGDGATVTLPTSCVSNGGGDGSYASPAGTLYSDVVRTTMTAGWSGVALELTHEVPAELHPALCTCTLHRAPYPAPCNLHPAPCTLLPSP